MKLRVAVLYGGRSAEHEVSVRSAKAIMEALDKERFEVKPIFITKEGRWEPKPIIPEPGANPDIDVVFPVLHGTFGEDGTVQGLLELADLPYVGAGVLASAAGMDKEIMKRLCLQQRLPVVEFVTVRGKLCSVETIEAQLSYPVFVKPARLGSSVGISKARNRDELKAALELAAKYDEKVLVERAIRGKEIECAVLGNLKPQASIPCQIVPSKEFYDYEDKYILDRAKFLLPAPLSEETTRKVQELAVACFQAISCEGMARVDFFLEEGTERLYINEINTIPGFTSISMYPRMWEASGLPFPALVERLIELALERYHRRKQLRFSL